jgi:hypothetical protein
MFGFMFLTTTKHKLVFNRKIKTKTKTRYKIFHVGFKIGIFSKEEISNIFVLFDLKREGFIDRERCK